MSISLAHASASNAQISDTKVQQNERLSEQDSQKILILGDSLSAGYQMAVEDSWAFLLKQKFEQVGDESQAIEVINASISGDTSGNGAARLENLLKLHQPDYLLIELGANDGLRGFSPNEIETNLTQMIQLAKSKGVTPILMQIRMPPNYGKRYTDAFAAVYPKVANAQDVPLIPFFLEQVIIKPEWMKQDGLHPNEEAQPWIRDFMFEALNPLITVNKK